MKILFVTASLPYPPQQGGALRTYGLLHGLHQAGHELTLLSFSSTPNVNTASTPLADFCKHIESLPTPNRSKSQRLRDLFLSRQPDIAHRLYNSAFAQRLRELITAQNFDIIQFEGIEVACYLPIVKQMRVASKLVYDAFNAEAAMQYAIYQIDRQNLRRWLAAAYSFIQSRRIAQFEQTLCSQADLVIAVSPEDAAILQQYAPAKRVPVVANGIFVNDYEKPQSELDMGEHALVFTGKMDYRPNVDAALWFAEHILPTIKQTIPDTKLYVVGQQPHGSLEHLRDNAAIVVTGWVESVLPYLKNAQIYVAPLRMGSGTRLKILEAMASGAAVIATHVAASGMKRTSDMGIVIADEPEQMAQVIIQLLGDASQRSQLGDAARHYVRQYYDWSVIIPDLLKAYEAIYSG